MRLLREGGPVVRVGHRGAAALAPPNTLASIRAAAGCGVDAVEVDVLLNGSKVVLCHSLPELVPDSPSLDDALELVRELGVGVQVDIKGHGHEPAVADALRRHALLDRAVASSFSARTLLALARAEPRLRRALTYPEDRHGLSGRRLVQPLVGPGLAAMRRLLPLRLPRWLRRVGADAATLHWSVVSRPVVARCHAAGVAVWVWTVNEPQQAVRLDALGADAIITDDPQIFRGSHLRPAREP